MSMIPFEATVAVLTSIVLPLVLLAAFTFLPSIIELEKPHDSGPRRIDGFTGGLTPRRFLIDVEVGPVNIQLRDKVHLIFPSFIKNIEPEVT